MASLQITSENQIQRLNGILNHVKTIQALDISQLLATPNSKSWNVVEVIAHLNISYNLYAEKIDAALDKLPNTNSDSKEFKARPWQKFVIEGQRPKEGIRKWKMKTLKRFEPLLSHEDLNREKIDAIFTEFFILHDHLKQSIIKSRSKEVSKAKITSAIGPLVRFYLPEAFEFLLSHMERHMVQIDEILG
ncbi:hypothetical protein DKG77_03940 [Flagellimonas aquimarina]|uniref:DinB-like domain-containing protein n=1 Tax=Flagellimonas aquimarina TaxID=2201895 RepID=A0A316L4Y5_9FLAO|nr:DinB family protein [Allomuricauda koreensis]PWL39989.1 hypothetical protein DKG77_03940 [Allomuricauda koreensis]